MSAEPTSPASIDAALDAAIGHDPTLLAELRGAFLESAYAHLHTIETATNVSVRQAAAWRLHGLAASFAATALMDRAADVGSTNTPDPRLVARARAALEALAG